MMIDIYCFYIHNSSQLLLSKVHLYSFIETYKKKNVTIGPEAPMMSTFPVIALKKKKEENFRIFSFLT